MKQFKEFFSPLSWRLAIRDARPQWRTLLLYTSSMIAGIAALVAILSFRSDVLLTVDAQSKELLGADLEFEHSAVFPDSVEAFIDSIDGSQAELVEFNSMIQFLKTGDTRLSQIRAIDGEFPFYGSIESDPASASDTYQNESFALVEQSAMEQFGIQTGDSIRLGNITLKIGGALVSVPGEAAAFSLIGPRVYVSKSILNETGLLQRGSRVEYKRYIKLEDPNEAAAIEEAFSPLAREFRVRVDTIEERREDFQELVDNLSRFLGLIAFIALLLGGLGVTSAIYVYIKRKSKTVATLRCLGFTKEKILATFAIQVAAIGMLGAILGTIFGVGIQLYLPAVFSGLLPFEIVQSVSIPAILLGLCVGVVISLVFSMMPLVTISTISPLLTLRSIEFSPVKALSTKAKILTVIISLTIFTAVISLLTGSIYAALGFNAGLIGCLILLWLIALLFTKIVRSLRLKTFSYTVRQGMANLFRPNNQTSLLIITLGMGMLLIGTLYLSQDMLLQRIDFQSGESLPDVVFYDIQKDQNEQFTNIVENTGAIMIENVPIVAMRLSSRKGVPVNELRQDTTLNISRWALTREYRVTYRDSLKDTESIIDGEWIGEAEGLQSVVPISIADQIDEDLKVNIGDTLGFNIQGVPVTTVVASIRSVQFDRPEPNFFILFPKGVLEPAPQFYAATVRTGSRETSQLLQQRVVSELPNISAIDISIALASVQEFLDKISLAIQFMAFFSILTGFIVLASSIAISRKQRTRESILLRTLGADKKLIGSIQTIEYALLGLLSGLSGLLLAVLSSWLLAAFFFDIDFVPDLLTLGTISLIVTLSAIVIGWSGSRHIFKRTPLEILRLENA